MPTSSAYDNKLLLPVVCEIIIIHIVLTNLTYAILCLLSINTKLPRVVLVCQNIYFNLKHVKSAIYIPSVPFCDSYRHIIA